MEQLTADSLPMAIKTLFELNNYRVSGPLQVHGAEIDLVVEAIGQPFTPKIYIEATIQYVDNDKYGKDVGKLAMIGEIEKGARKLIVSSKGFALPVKERAAKTGIETFTYRELQRLFEQFDAYLSHLEEGRGDEPIPKDVSDIYEEPDFADATGNHAALSWLDDWSRDTNAAKWLIVVGEYGTGKTALTQVLQYRWAMEHIFDPERPIPFRLELRDFVRQFNASGLLHHFLDANGLQHVPIDFVFSLIRSGRIILILDGYDEMAQHLSARERRTCLEALSKLASGGARGILTSRPNYFSEVEEYHVLEMLYSSLDSGRMFLTQSDRDFITQEREIDDLIEKQFLNRFERSLRDLTEGQTRELVNRKLSEDSAGRDVVLSILNRVFRADGEGSTSLSGKPVIITYLLAVVDQLKGVRTSEASEALTEWDVYKLVIDQLMLRDLNAGVIQPVKRRRFLQELAVWLSQKTRTTISENDFRSLVSEQLSAELRSYAPEDRARQTDAFFDDLKRSSTLTRASTATSVESGWRFSHNSLREYLLCERAIQLFPSVDFDTVGFRVTDAMRIFVSSRGGEAVQLLFQQLAAVWPDKSYRGAAVGRRLELVWDALLQLHAFEEDPVRALLLNLSGDAESRISMTDLSIREVSFSTIARGADLSRASFARAELSECVLSGAACGSSSFANAFLDNVDFSSSDLTGAIFTRSILIDVNLVNATLQGADFRAIDGESSAIVQGPNGALPERVEGGVLRGFLKYSGALTDDVSDYDLLRNDPRFEIIDKFMRRLSEGSIHQVLGLTQRGVSSRNSEFAAALLDVLTRHGVVTRSGGRNQTVSVTSSGRAIVGRYVEHREVPTFVTSMLNA